MSVLYAIKCRIISMCNSFSYLNILDALPREAQINVNRFAKTRNNPTFVKTQIFASWCSTYLKPSSVAVSSLYYK